MFVIDVYFPFAFGHFSSCAGYWTGILVIAYIFFCFVCVFIRLWLAIFRVWYLIGVWLIIYMFVLACNCKINIFLVTFLL